MPKRIWIIWALFLVRGAFYSAMLPLWEGWDEYAHFAWIEHWNDRGTLPVATDKVSQEIDESMRLAPLARELRWLGAPYLIHEEWRALPAAESEARVRALAVLSPSLAHEAAASDSGKKLVFYEAQQPPLYYWLAAPLERALADEPLRRRVFWVRLWGVLLTSAAIPIVFLTARRVFAGSGGEFAGSCCAGLLAVAPGLVIDAARVANDGLAIALAGVLLWLLTRERFPWVATGCALGAGLLVKASLLVMVPVVAVIWWPRDRKRTAGALALAALIGGWWYGRNLAIGAPLTGWQESVGFGALATSAAQLGTSGRWIGGAQTIAKSFTWFGAWSFLTLRTWMYVALEGVGVAAVAAGIFRYGRRAKAAVTMVAGFGIAIAGGAAAYNAVHGIPGIPGWYLWPAGGAMAILASAGMGRFTPVFAAMLAAADLFGAAARMMPYYSGLAAWNHGSLLQAGAAAERLGTPMWLVAAWAAATVAIPALLFHGSAKTRT